VKPIGALNMNESDLGYAGGGPGNTDNKWGKDPKFSWWEKLMKEPTKSNYLHIF
jgi:hypothetical protein